MMREQIHGWDGSNASITSKVFVFVLVAIGIACAVLLVLGLWILLAIAVCAMAVVALCAPCCPEVVHAVTPPMAT